MILTTYEIDVHPPGPPIKRAAGLGAGPAGLGAGPPG